MNDEVKRYEYWMHYDEGGMEMDDEGEYVKYTDYQSTRQELAETKARLEALEDILLAFENCEFLSEEQNEAHYIALQNSRARKQK